MRPVCRGSVPLLKNGTAKSYSKYGDARPDLVERLGEYCSYCERPILQGTDLAVEHIYAKQHFPHLERDWENFLLACRNCNSVKGDQTDTWNHRDYLWPHEDNTARAFCYLPGGRVKVDSSQLSSGVAALADRTLTLTGLGRYPGSGAKSEPAERDYRWLHRQEAWGAAQRALKNLGSNNSPEMREQIVATAIPQGFWSVWMTVFAQDEDMRCRLLHAFVGTAADCFALNTQPVPRRSGRC